MDELIRILLDFFTSDDGPEIYDEDGQPVPFQWIVARRGFEPEMAR